MTEYPENRSEDEPDDDAEQGAEVASDIEDDDAASVLFFGDRLENLVHGEKVSGANITNETESVEKTPMDSPSALFFGESLEEAARREAGEGAEEAPADNDTGNAGANEEDDAH